MAKTYEQIAKQIEALQQQADVLKRQEAIGVIGRIKEAIAFYGLTADDLGFGGAEPTAAAAVGREGKQAKAVAQKAGKRVSVVRYRDDKGNSWSGMGPKPRWMVEGLASGKSLRDFDVPGDA